MFPYPTSLPAEAFMSRAEPEVTPQLVANPGPFLVEHKHSPPFPCYVCLDPTHTWLTYEARAATRWAPSRAAYHLPVCWRCSRVHGICR